MILLREEKYSDFLNQFQSKREFQDRRGGRETQLFYEQYLRELNASRQINQKFKMYQNNNEVW